MVDNHLKAFQGQNTDLIIESESRSDHSLDLYFISKDKNKKSSLRLSLEDIASIICVIEKDLFKWEKLFHENLKITFVWEDKNTKKLWIHLGEDSKILSLGQILVLKLYLYHLLDEKIRYSTIKRKCSSYQEESSNFENTRGANIEISMNDTMEIDGSIINETEKAMLIRFYDKRNVWIPKSSIHSQFNPNSSSLQSLMIESWVLKKNNLDQFQK